MHSEETFAPGEGINCKDNEVYDIHLYILRNKDITSYVIWKKSDI